VGDRRGGERKLGVEHEERKIEKLENALTVAEKADSGGKSGFRVEKAFDTRCIHTKREGNNMGEGLNRKESFDHDLHNH
jgi:hypothetical protein